MLHRLAVISSFFCGVTCLLASSLAASPATQPAVDVVVAPFSPLDEAAAPQSLGLAAQKSLIADLARAHFHPSQTADSAAKYLIRGTYQTSNQMIRFTAELVDNKTGSIVGGLNATGDINDLFSIEDALSTQALRQLRHLTNPQLASAVPAAPPTLELEPAVRYLAPAQPSYLAGERAPSNEYTDQEYAARYRQLYGADYLTGYCGYRLYYGGFAHGYGYGYGGYGHGINANFYGASTR